MNKTRKGFTIVELVIVIAVIAILAAVLMPTFTNIINKANTAADMQIVANLNKALATEKAYQTGADYLYPQNAFAVAKEYGYSVEKIVAKSNLNIAYDHENKRFVLLDETNNTITYPTDDDTKELYVSEDDRVNYFVVRSTNESTYEGIIGKDEDQNVVYSQYSIYAGYKFNATKVVLHGVGFDSGSVNTIEEVVYENNSGNAKDVVIRTNTFGTKLSVNGTDGDTVTHYGFAGLVEVTKVAMSSYDEYGVVGRLSATAEGATGHIDIKEGATVYQVEQLGGTSTSVSVDENATVYDINHEKVEGAVNNTTERFTEQAVVDKESVDGDPDGERITAHNCEHHYTEDVVDGQHVYEVCKTCGYTLIKVDGIKKTVSTENEEEQKENVIIPKAAYDGSQVTASTADNGEVQINIDSSTGDYVEPSIEKTPEVNSKGEVDLACKHEWADAVSNGNGKHTIKCDKCGISYSEDCNKDGEGGACSRCDYKKVIAMNSRTNKYYYYGEDNLAFVEASPSTDTIILLDDLIVTTAIPNEIEFSLNGNKITIQQENIEGQIGWLYSDYYINIGSYPDGLLSEDGWYPCDTTTYRYWYKSAWYTMQGVDFYDYYYTDYPTKFRILEPSLIATYTEFTGNTTSLKLFAGGYGTVESPYLISNFSQLSHMKPVYDIKSSDTIYFKLIKDIDLTDVPLEKEEYGDMFYWWSLKKGLDLDLGNHALLNLSCNMFYTPANLTIHDGIVNFTGNGNLLYDYGNGGTNHTVTYKNLTLTGNVDTSLSHYGPLASFAGNNSNKTQCTTVICENISSYVNIKGTQTYVGGLFGYCCNTNMSLKNCNIYGNISTTGPVGGFFEGSQYHSCGCITTDGKGITKIEDCAFYGTIIVPTDGTAYYAGPNVSNDANYKATSASICKAIDISQKIILPENLGETIQIDANSEYTKYVVILSFNVDYIDGRAGGYPQAIVYEIENENDTTGAIDTPLKKYQLIEDEYRDGDTKYDTQIIFRTSDNTLVHDGVNVFKLASYGVSVSVYAYTGDTLKAVGYAWYNAE